MTRPTFESGFDQRIADWLEADPDRAPDAVLGTVLVAFPSIPQRRALRAPWSANPMNRVFLAAIAGATIVAIAVGSALLFTPSPVGPSASGHPSARQSGSDGATVTPSAADSSSLTEHVTSAAGDLTIRFPSNWTIRGSSSADSSGSIGAEHIVDQSQSPETFFVGWSVPLADGQSPEQWIADQVADPNQIGCHETRAAEVTIGGRVGVSLANGCPILGRLHYFAVVVVNRRGYSFHMDTRTSSLGDASFTALLANVSFQP